MNLFQEEEGRLKGSRVHVTLIDELFAQAHHKTFDSKFKESLKRLQNFQGIEKVALPKSLHGSLRPYQEAGYYWLHFLRLVSIAQEPSKTSKGMMLCLLAMVPCDVILNF